MTQDKCNFSPQNKIYSWNEVFKIVIRFVKKFNEIYVRINACMNKHVFTHLFWNEKFSEHVNVI